MSILDGVTAGGEGRGADVSKSSSLMMTTWSRDRHTHTLSRLPTRLTALGKGSLSPATPQRICSHAQIAVVRLVLLIILQRSRISEKLSGLRPIRSPFRNTSLMYRYTFQSKRYIIIPVHVNDHDHNNLDLLHRKSLYFPIPNPSRLVDESQPNSRERGRGDQHEHVLDDQEHAERIRRSVRRVDLRTV
jgi:hypothetical protein